MSGNAKLGPTGTRWSIDGDHRIAWTVRPNDVHTDHVEMSGRRVAVVVTYGVDALGRLHVSRDVVWPLLRFVPNRTRDHLALSFGGDAFPRMFVDDAPRRHFVAKRFTFDGILVMEGILEESPGVAFRRKVFPCLEQPAVLEVVALINNTDRAVRIEIEPNARRVVTDPERGIDGGYVATATVRGTGARTLRPGETLTFTLELMGGRADAEPAEPEPDAEEWLRRERVAALQSTLRLKTPDPVINTLFALTKLHAGESIYATRNGPMHSPGGGVFYAAMWANDQAEYANPYFGYLGDAATTAAAINCFRQFARYTNPEYRPLPSAIVAEGLNTWHGAGDRGDAAMLAYGIGRFALPHADPSMARELWPLLEWCLEFCHRKLTPDGVVASDSDELENRFPAGKANLCTASLYYDALQSAVCLGRELAVPEPTLRDYAARSARLAEAIERHFGAEIEGFATYRYYEGNTVLRSWIGMPLAVGLLRRAEGTLDALFSPRLWGANGVLTQAGDATFWDRTTLYALRAAFVAGAVERGLAHLVDYSSRRLLGDHVPYPVEAFPEGNQRQLSAESALYGRILTEGLFGLRPTGFRSFAMRPRLPSHWPQMALRGIHAHGEDFAVVVDRRGENLAVSVSLESGASVERTLDPGAEVEVDLRFPLSQHDEHR